MRANARRYYRENSERMGEAARRWVAANPGKVSEIQRAAKSRRRARIQGGEVVPYDRLEVFARDGWVCQLCMEPIDREARSPAPLSPSIDHIIPISQGGGDTPSNVQASHRVCNTRKGARLSA